MAARPILVIGVNATTALAQYSAVTAAGATAAAGENAVGFTQTIGAIGERVPVTAGGTAVAIAGASVALDDALQVGTGGKLIKATTGKIVARALSAGVANASLEVLVINN